MLETRIFMHCVVSRIRIIYQEYMYACITNAHSSSGAALAAGWEHMCAVLTGGVVNCWGNNVNGSLGTGDTKSRLTPTAVTGLGSGDLNLCVQKILMKFKGLRCIRISSLQ